MRELNMNNLQEAFPIPEDSIYLDQDLELSKRELIIKALKKILEDKKLNLPLGPTLDLNNPERSIILNKFDVKRTNKYTYIYMYVCIFIYIYQMFYFYLHHTTHYNN